MLIDEEADEPWRGNPLQIDQPEGTVVESEPVWVMQIRQPYGGWDPFSNPRQDRDEVTRIQAFHLNKDENDLDLRVWKKVVIWTLDEVPGHNEGQTPPAEIIARNEANTPQQPAE